MLWNEARRFSQEQYDMLKRCSDKKDMSEWNEWRKANREEDIELDGGDFVDKHLQGMDLNGGWYKYKDRNGKLILIKQGKVYMRGANFCQAKMQGAKLRDVHLEGAFFYYTRLEGAVLQGASVDSYTEFWKCYIDHKTNFCGVALEGIRIDPAVKQLLENNIRRMNWEDWYKEHLKLKWLVKPFWWTSDYGLSTGRIIFTFFGLALIFANIYLHWGRIAPPGIVKYLFVDRSGVEVQPCLVPLRTLYFSIVTMTTLGFGDMYANAHSIWGHILLGVQVILGYVLLGALVTRFAVLFTAGGPAGKFADEKGEKDETEKRAK